MNSISAVELNYIIYRYLIESGFVHTAFNFKFESGINNLPIDGDLVPHATLIELVQTGLSFKEMQANAANNPDDEEFCFQPIRNLITNNVSELQKIVKGREVNPSATEPKDLAKKGNQSASESDVKSSDDSQYVASLRGIFLLDMKTELDFDNELGLNSIVSFNEDDTQDPSYPTEDELFGQVNDWTSGTGIAGYVGSGFIVVGGDGRAVRRDKFGDFTVLCAGNDQKLTVIQDEFVVAIAGSPQLGQAFFRKVMDMFGSRNKRRGLHSFAYFCNLQAEVDRIGSNSEFVIMALGFSRGDTYVYCTITKTCRIAKLGSIHGIGSAFETIKKHFKKGIKCYEGDEKLERNKEAVISLLKGAFCVGCILEDSCGGKLDIAILKKGEGAVLRNEGHLIKIMSSSIEVIKNFLKLCILVAQKGRKYSGEEHDTGTKMIKQLFPLSNMINIIGVIRSKSKKSETIIYMVSFLCEGDLRRMAVAYGEQRLDEGVWLRVEKPNRQVLSKYAKKIMNNHYF